MKNPISRIPFSVLQLLRVAIPTFLFINSGCSISNPNTGKTQATERLLLAAADGTSFDSFVADHPKYSSSAPQNNESLRSVCVLAETSNPQILGLDATDVVKPVVKYLTGWAGKYLINAAKKYEAEYSAAFSGSFFTVKKTELSANYRCFRLTRFVDRRVAFDFIGKIDPSEDRSALKIIPIYLYAREAKAKAGRSGVINYIITTDLKSFGLNGGSVDSSEASITTIADEVNLSDQPYEKNFLEGSPKSATSQNANTNDAWLPGVAHVLLPNGGASQTGNFTLTVRVKEIGKSYLADAMKAAGEALDEQKGSIADSASTAAKDFFSGNDSKNTTAASSSSSDSGS